ncbi:phosphoribosyltransferase, partial [Streptomyces fradiae]
GRAGAGLRGDAAPAGLVLAVPVGDRRAVAELRTEVDDLVCLSQPADFRAVGLWYEDFEQVGDEEVLGVLAGLAVPARLRPTRHR